MLSKTDYEELIEKDIYKKCALTESGYFYITDNYGFDLTHDLWLGIIPLKISLVLTSFLDNGFFDIELINSRIKSFNYGSNDIKNKPNLLFISEKMVKCKQKAAKMSCLFKLLPFIIGKICYLKF